MGCSSSGTPVQPGQKFPSPRAFGAFAAWRLVDSGRVVDMLVFSRGCEALPKSEAGWARGVSWSSHRGICVKKGRVPSLGHPHNSSQKQDLNCIWE